MAALTKTMGFAGCRFYPANGFDSSAITELLVKTPDADTRYAHIGEQVPVEVVGVLEDAGIELLDCAECLACAARFSYEEPPNGFGQEYHSPAAHSRW